MRVLYAPSNADIKRMREKCYLTQCPIEKQLEALTEAIIGRPEKQEKMLSDFKKIRELYIYKESD